MLAVVLTVVGMRAVFAQPRAEGDRLRERLAAEPPRASLAGEVRLAVHLGRARVGEMVLRTEIVEKGGEKLYHLDDRIAFESPTLGIVRIEVDAEVASDLSVR